MALKNETRNLCILLCLGVALVAYGAGMAYVETTVNRLAAALIILGAGALLICIARIRRLMPKMLSGSRWKRHGLFILLIVLWAGLYVEVNCIAYRHNTRWDLTRAHLHTLTASTADVISRLYQGIRVTAFQVGLPPKYLEDLFREYQRLSGGKTAAILHRHVARNPARGSPRDIDGFLQEVRQTNRLGASRLGGLSPGGRAQSGVPVTPPPSTALPRALWLAQL